jgi:hypothetical protein
MGCRPIVLISGYDPSSVALRARRLSINEFLVKPFSQEKLCEAVKNVIDSSSIPEAQRAPLVAFIRRQERLSGDRSDVKAKGKTLSESSHLPAARVAILPEFVFDFAISDLSHFAISLSVVRRDGDENGGKVECRRIPASPGRARRHFARVCV